jgi:hypothetical protein
MLESLLFVFTLLAACLVMVWAARNDQQERHDPLSRLLAVKQAPEKAESGTGDAGTRRRRGP